MQVATSSAGRIRYILARVWREGRKVTSTGHIQTEARKPVACLSFLGKFEAVAVVHSKTPGPCRRHARQGGSPQTGNSTRTLRVQANASAVGVRAAIEVLKWWCHHSTREGMEMLIPPVNVLLSEVAEICFLVYYKHARAASQLDQLSNYFQPRPHGPKAGNSPSTPPSMLSGEVTFAWLDV